MDNIKDNKLNTVTGGNNTDDLEEFNWKTKGYNPLGKDGNVSSSNERLEVLEEREKFVKETFTWKNKRHS